MFDAFYKYNFFIDYNLQRILLRFFLVNLALKSA